MARKSLALELLTQNQLEEMEADVIRGDLSWRALGEKYAVPHATLRSFAEKKGIIRNPTGLKRQLVEKLMSQPEPTPAPAVSDSAQPNGTHSAQQTVHSATRVESTPRDDIEAAAQEDARDMRFGLSAARLALNLVGLRLNQAKTDSQYGPREIKVLSESIAINVQTIRQIRGLDVQLDPGDVKNMTDEQLEAIISGKGFKSTRAIF
jgi:hypothetical protein